MRRLLPTGTHVIKMSPQLDAEWGEKMAAILELWKPRAFTEFFPGGYRTRFINGWDLYGNKVFNKKTSTKPAFRNTIVVKAGLERIFDNAQMVGEALGFTFPDITCANVLYDGRNVVLVDFDQIVDYPLNPQFQTIWDTTKALHKIL